MTDNSSEKILNSIKNGIEDVKGEDIVILDLKEIDNSVCDYFVVCSGNSNTQVAAIANSVERTVRKEISERPINTEGKDNAKWVLIDYASVVVHVFQKPVREYYNIEGMWGDAKEINV
ncbi:ribosome silencing factor [Weeksellaceae bacterium TAE3-ERU29]|nr:ribosome silencing factor [Weeksellaceae bacterium TAE3-ERU29]